MYTLACVLGPCDALRMLCCALCCALCHALCVLSDRAMQHDKTCEMTYNIAVCTAYMLQIVGPSIYKTYLSAAQRLGLSEEAAGYW